MRKNEPMLPERSLAGKNFVFFGGSTGMGKAAAVEVGKRGACVLIIGRGREAGQAAADAVGHAGAASAEYLYGDLSTVAGVGAVAEAVRAWRPNLHGVMHTAMTATRNKIETTDGFEFAFALQYFARAALNRLLLDHLAASGDGRIVHIGGDVPSFIKVDLDDLQFEARKWGFMKSILGTHVLGELHIQEAARRWQGLPVTIAVSCVGSTNTKTMADPQMPFYMRLMGRFGAAAEVSAQNAVRFLTMEDVRAANGATLRNPKTFTPQRLVLNQQDAERLWSITESLAKQRGFALP
ncbi:SDR family NAD(P)-dependent oxidoreductase [Pseudomonas corrugata]|uniref:SDR family NAD(P)-dependent oxidoreductase n=1 Tax=Pseudomonas corrugata TaxID=47879 RepID=UPI001585E5A1|nr:SDR family NAD(P)-dependent oxidoreductase [Pseudomonas corrugata]MCI0995628.1 SDR family NAD(P)-dependent oxidoreductase [Pseudomonas corrugata]NUT64679.1 SDR family NAD(P)-dependent oxidoreductase [Pseudomonas corrugata]